MSICEADGGAVVVVMNFEGSEADAMATRNSHIGSVILEDPVMTAQAYEGRKCRVKLWASFSIYKTWALLNEMVTYQAMLITSKMS